VIANTLPLGLQDNPRLEQWIGFENPGRVRIATGKVELGQGIRTAVIQVAADELDVAPSRIDLASGDTGETPSEGYTAGSMSVENSAGSVRLVAAEVRAMMCALAAAQLKCAEEALTISDGQILRNGAATGLDYWQLAPGLNLTGNATGSQRPKAKSERRLIGTNLPRVDLPGKIMGAEMSFIHDMRPLGVLHARVLRQPWPSAQVSIPSTMELAAILNSSARLVRINEFTAVVAESERLVVSSAETLAPRLQWSGGRPLSAEQAKPEWLSAQPSVPTTAARGNTSAASAADKRLSRTYTKQFLAHASIAPSCALARFENGNLTVWTHSQGVFPLRGALAAALHLDPSKVRVIHVAGAGCYGHNGADDAACDAAIIAREMPSRTVRVLWSRADELASAPLGTAMVVALEAELTTSGLPRTWTTSIWGGPHVRRPGVGGGVNLLAAEQLPDQPPSIIPQEMPEAAGGSGTRNAWLLYDVPQQTLKNHLITNLEPRTSSMRGLGAFANIFAIESFIDELAREAKIDPVTYRLQMMTDPRARGVIAKAAAMSAWKTGEVRPEGRGRGVAFGRYKNRAGYLALVVDVHVDESVRLKKVWCAVDAGLVVNPDGIRNQVEGGIIQSASWTLKEQVTFDEGRVATRSWDTYPILKFSEVPDIEIEIIDSPDDRPLGVGEVAQGPTAAAIANAVADALGVRIRDLPLTRERIIAAL
jgi:nicotinate dehydrogenase subunit B